MMSEKLKKLNSVDICVRKVIWYFCVGLNFGFYYYQRNFLNKVVLWLFIWPLYELFSLGKYFLSRTKNIVLRKILILSQTKVILPRKKNKSFTYFQNHLLKIIIEPDKEIYWNFASYGSNDNSCSKMMFMIVKIQRI